MQFQEHQRVLQFQTANEITPSKVLNLISPVPERVLQVRRRAKHVGTSLTPEEHINKRKSNEEEKENEQMKKLIKIGKKTENIFKLKKKRKIVEEICSSSDYEDNIMVAPQKDDESDNCRGCGENYYRTVLSEDWLSSLYVLRS
ncbi:hypothetical protein JTB14_029671 [Gonioctena quinquepunctata]|nr:hypothetical protein JTB14_029671 [Gonioctena quinquepunctata]